jgi:hypothetical protein
MTHKFCNADHRATYPSYLTAALLPHHQRSFSSRRTPSNATVVGRCARTTTTPAPSCLRVKKFVTPFRWHYRHYRINMMIPNDTLSNIHDLSMVTQPLSRLTPTHYPFSPLRKMMINQLYNRYTMTLQLSGSLTDAPPPLHLHTTPFNVMTQH